MKPPGSHPDIAFIARLKRFSETAALAVMLTGLLVLGGWSLHIDFLKNLLPGLVTMKPLTATALSLSGAALWLLRLDARRTRQSRIGHLIAWIVAAIGGATLFEYVSDTDIGIDRLLFRDAVLAEDILYPGRPAPSTAFCLWLSGMALLFLDVKRLWLLLTPALLSLLISMLALLGYAYNVSTLYQMAPFASIALHTAVALAALNLGLLTARPEQPFIAVLTTKLAGSAMARRILPAAVLVPFFLGWLRLAGQRTGLYGTEFGLALHTMSNIVVFAALVYRTAFLLNQADAQREAGFTEALESNQRFRLLADASPNGLIMIDQSGRIRMANKQAEILFGYLPGGLDGQPIESLVPVRFQDLHLIYRDTFTVHSEPRAMGVGRDLFGLRRDGQEFPVEIGLKPLTMAGEQFTLASIIDISERKQMDNKLRRNEEVLRLFVEHSPAAIAMFDRDMNYIVASRRYSVDYNLGEQSLVGRCHYDVLPETPENWKKIHRDCLSGAIAHEDADPFPRPDGSVDWVRWEIRPWYEINGEIGGIILFSEVITARRQAEIELHKSEEHFRKIFENAVAGIAIKDMAGKFQHCNTAYCNLLGYGIEELRQIEISALVHPDDREAIMSKIHQLQAGRLPHFEIENRYIRKNGESVWARKYVSTLSDEYGKPALLLTIVIDITELKNAEAALVHSHQHLERQIQDRTRELDEAKRQAERDNAFKTRFLTAASHDLRQPLQSAGLYLSVLSHRLEDSESRELCDDMRESLTMMGNILDALLDISRIECGSMTPIKKDFVLSDLLSRIVTNTILQAEAKGLSIEYQKNDCVVHSDPALLERIIENFVINAIRYTEKGRITLACECEGGMARIAVKDTGSGIPSHELKNIFNAYYQLNNSEQNRRQGLGLGLAIVKQIAAILDCPLDVQSSLNQGSVFTVQVPLGNPVRSGVKTTDLSSAPYDGRNGPPIVLFIEDDPAISRAMKILCKAHDVKVYFVRSGEDALTNVQAGIRPDLVITDYQLPESNGIETIIRIRAITRYDFPAVIITGDTSLPQILANKPRNCAVFHKPVDPQSLLALIANATPVTAETQNSGPEHI